MNCCCLFPCNIHHGKWISVLEEIWTSRKMLHYTHCREFFIKTAPDSLTGTKRAAQTNLFLRYSLWNLNSETWYKWGFRKSKLIILRLVKGVRWLQRLFCRQFLSVRIKIDKFLKLFLLFCFKCLPCDNRSKWTCVLCKGYWELELTIITSP